MPDSAQPYDVIIIGGGVNGAGVARDAAGRGARVLLLEAGPAGNHPDLEAPLAFARLQRTVFDWAYYTVPQSELGGRPVAWPRGRVLGGSSGINAMVYMRGRLEDYERWGRNWRAECVLAAFKRGENQERPALRGGAWHGSGGEQNVADLRCVNPLSRSFMEAAGSLGWPRNDDFNGERQEGVGLFQVTQRNGRRESAAAAYLTPVRHRRNLQIMTGALVRRLRFDGDRAVGVEFSSGCELLYAEAESEIVLAAGAIESPKLLLLSGIGPPEELRALGIRVRAASGEVGSNLQDHPRVAVAFRCEAPVSLLAGFGPQAQAEFERDGMGPLTSNGAEAGAFHGDLQFHFLPLDLANLGLDPTGHHGFTVAPTLLTPRSRGRVRLAASDPARAPVIDPGYLTDAADVAALREGVRLAYRLAATPAFAEYGARAGSPPGDVDELIRNRLDTCYHPGGTCAIGAVVDQELRVNGVRGLRVADASVMPTLPRGNTHAPVAMIGERAAEFLRGPG